MASAYIGLSGFEKDLAKIDEYKRRHLELGHRVLQVSSRNQELLI